MTSPRVVLGPVAARFRVAALTLIGCAVLACGSSDPRAGLPRLSERGERLTIGLAADVELCEGTVAALDRHIAWLEAQTGLEHSGRAAVYVLDTAATQARCANAPLRQACFETAANAAFVSHEGLDLESLRHELVHDFAWNTELGLQPPLLAEGLAALLGNDACQASFSRSPMRALLELRAGSRLLAAEIWLGAAFLQFLRDRHGADELIEFLSDLHERSSLDELQSAFAAHFGEPLDDAVTVFDRGRPQLLPDAAFCAGEALNFADGRAQIETEFACDDERIATEITAGRPPRQLRARLEVPEPGEYRLESSNPEDRWQLRDCACTSDGPRALVADDRGGAEVVLAAGSYRVSFFGSGGRGTHTLTVMRLSAAR